MPICASWTVYPLETGSLAKPPVIRAPGLGESAFDIAAAATFSRTENCTSSP
ncbi:MAG: hypothetical protein LBB81_10170 [Treponema sp.]|nr:hypothetical protein [Treponema sp.]